MPCFTYCVYNLSLSLSLSTYLNPSLSYQTSALGVWIYYAHVHTTKATDKMEVGKNKTLSLTQFMRYIEHISRKDSMSNCSNTWLNVHVTCESYSGSHRQKEKQNTYVHRYSHIATCTYSHMQGHKHSADTIDIPRKTMSN